ncbi:MAG: peptidoglycan-binding protein [Parcubacteria group bacterium]|nr:peptidoglycan-binding protein [Parcubacteria group bacterium]
MFSRLPPSVILPLFIGGLLLVGSAYLDIPVLRFPGELVANTIFGVGLSPDELRVKYWVGPLPILIVPGHDNDSWGTQFKGLKESDVNVALGYLLYDLLAKDPRFVPMINRAPDGEYALWFESYMKENKVAIEQFRTQSKVKTRYFAAQGLYDPRRLVHHNPAADNVSLSLYAINKWANDQNVPVVLHLHFNDYPRRRAGEAGEYSGFAIYVPETQLPNARASAALAETVAERLMRVVGPSNLPKEKGLTSSGVEGPIVPDQELIAVGSNGSRDGASLVIEYSYIYEPQLHDAEVRRLFMRELAHQTYLGLKTFFDSTALTREGVSATTLLPYEWPSKTFSDGMRGKDVFALQSALRIEGYYPPSGLSLASCPLSGVYGPCTTFAVKAFQNAKGLSSSGIIDESTLTLIKGVRGK